MKPQTARTTLAFSALVTLLAGCASNPAPPPAPAGPTEFEQRLSRMSADVRGLLTQLNTLEHSRQQLSASPKPVHQDLPQDHTLRRPVTLTWKGDVRVVLSRLAEQADLKFATLGTTPVTLIVGIDVHGAELGAVLERVATQIGGVADIVFVEDKGGAQGAIELRYRGG